MSGGGKEVTVGYRYFLGMHLVVCKGPVDALTAIQAGQRYAWLGHQAASGTITIDNPGLFGGDEREGGIQGGLELMMGDATQGANAYLTAQQGGNQSGHRGVLSAVWNGGMVSANNPYLKPWAFRVRRVLQGWKSGAGVTPWNPTKAPINLGGSVTSVAATDFSDRGLYSTLLGNGALYTIGSGPYGPTMDCAAQAAATPANIIRFTGGLNVTAWEVKLLVVAGNADDSTALLLRDSTGTVNRIGIIPRREGTTMPMLVNGPGLVQLGATPLTPGVWYKFRCTITGTNISAQITVADTGAAVHAPLNTSGASTVGSVGAVVLNTDSGLLTSPMRYSDLRIESTISGVAMNPAHIIYECLTNLEWGMGYSTAAINDSSFSAAADIFYAEGLGLCLHWTQQQPIKDFVQVVLDHAGAMLSQEPTTGLFTLTPLRGGYTPSSLPLFDESNVSHIERYEKSGPPEVANEITVRFDSLEKAEVDSVKVQNLGMIVAQGGVVAKTITYPGFPTAALAMRAAMRDLLAGSQPLGRVRLFTNRAGYTLRPGALVRWTWPKLGITTMVLRILAVDLGRLEEGLIGVDAVEDVFGVPSATYTAQPVSGWTPPNNTPTAATLRVVREAAYLEVLRTLGPSNTNVLEIDVGFVVATAVRPTADALDFGMLDRTGSDAFTEIGRGSFCPSGLISATLEPGATTATVTNLTDATLVELGTYAQLGTELVRVDAFSSTTGAITLGRGVMGTCAQQHAALSRIFFLDGFLAHDPTEYVDGEAVDVKLAPRTGLGQLAEGGAPTNTVVLDQIWYRPFAPGRLRINGADYPASASSLAISWAHRNRLQQNLEGDESGDIGPEPGTTYNAWLRQDSDSSVVDSATGLTGTSWTPATLPSSSGLYRIEIQAERGGVTSAHMQRHRFTWIDAFQLTARLIAGSASGGAGGTSVAQGKLLQANASLIAGAAYVA